MHSLSSAPSKTILPHGLAVRVQVSQARSSLEESLYVIGSLLLPITVAHASAFKVISPIPTAQHNCKRIMFLRILSPITLSVLCTVKRNELCPNIFFYIGRQSGESSEATTVSVIIRYGDGPLYILHNLGADLYIFSLWQSPCFLRLLLHNWQ
jgi:hypothetical protein